MENGLAGMLFTLGNSEKRLSNAADLECGREPGDSVSQPGFEIGLFCFCITFSRGDSNRLTGFFWPINLWFFIAALEAFFVVVIDSRQNTQSSLIGTIGRCAIKRQAKNERKGIKWS